MKTKTLDSMTTIHPVTPDRASQIENCLFLKMAGAIIKPLYSAKHGASSYVYSAPRGNHRAAACALSSGRVLKAIGARGAAL
jgi:hypothetical protein